MIPNKVRSTAPLYASIIALNNAHILTIACAIHHVTYQLGLKWLSHKHWYIYLKHISQVHSRCHDCALLILKFRTYQTSTSKPAQVVCELPHTALLNRCNYLLSLIQLSLGEMWKCCMKVPLLTFIDIEMSCEIYTIVTLFRRMTDRRKEDDKSCLLFHIDHHVFLCRIKSCQTSLSHSTLSQIL